MYVVGQGHEHMGPGTSLAQRINWNTGLESQMSGLGCAACGGSCGKCGLGLFDSGMDLSGWGWPEMAVAGLGVYMLFSTIFTTKRAVGTVRGTLRKRSSRAKKRRDLERQLQST